MNQEVLTLTPGGSALAQSLGFQAASAICDNFTNSYLELTDAGKTIPPWTYGAVVPLPPGVRRASAKLVTTTPAIPGPPVPLSVATLTWTDAVLPSDPGHLLQQSQYGSQTVIGTLAGNANTTVGPQTIAVPAGTMSIGYLVRGDGSNDTPQTVIIQGHQSANEYASATPLTNQGGPQWFLFAASDTSVDVTLTTNGSHPSAIDVLASPLVEILDLAQTFGSFVNAQLWAGTGSTGALTIDNPAVGVRLLGVSLADAAPALWQTFPSSKPIDITMTGADQAVGIGAVGKSLYLGPSAIWTSAAANVTFKDGSGGTSRWVEVTAAGGTSAKIPWDGLKLSSGNDLFVNGPNGTELRFTPSYNLG